VRVKGLEQGAQARDRLLEQLIDAVQFPLPESAVQTEVDAREHDIVHSLGHDDSLFDEFLSSQGKTREDFQAELRESAERAVRAQFILDTIAAQRNTQIADGELTEYLVRQAERYQMAPQEFANQVMQSGNLPMMVADIRRTKALSEVLQAAAITDSDGNPVDLSALLAEAPPEAADDVD
jgi:trigger factor